VDARHLSSALNDSSWMLIHECFERGDATLSVVRLEESGMMFGD
jgi:hypothetical protein